jgi:integrase
MSRRGKGEGSIYKRKDGRWVGVVDLGWNANGRIRKSVYGTTRKEVSDKLSKAIRAHRDGTLVCDERLTVEQFMDRWLAGKATHLRGSTWARYNGINTLHIVPFLGKMRLTKLEPQHLQSLYVNRLEEGLSPTSVLYVHRVLHTALGEAHRWGLAPRNVASVVTPPRPQRRTVRTLTPNEAQQLLDNAKGDRLEALYVTALTTGMRQGELLGLLWSDVDLDARVAIVQRSLQVSAGGKRELGPPKTTRSRRRVLLHRSAVKALEEHKRRQAAEIEQAMGAWTDMDLVFPNIVGQPIDPTNLIRRSFYPLLKSASLPRIRFHDLRHTAATLLLGQGVHPKVVSEMLGHSQISITLDLYSHVTETMLQAAVDAFDDVFGCQIGCPDEEDDGDDNGLMPV